MPRVTQRQLRLRSRLFPATGLATIVFLFLAGAAGAQPFNAWPVFTATQGKYVEVPNAPDLNPPTALTIEFWVSNYPTMAQGEECRTIIGKNYQTSYFVGICGGIVRSWLHGAQHDGGIVPTGQWTHVAVTYDGSHRIHYINGEQAIAFVETGTLPTNSSNVRIGSDVSWDYQPQGSVDEVRLWNYARSVEQIRGSINVPITSPQPGLIAVWNMDPGLADVVGGHNGTNVGSVPFLNFPVTLTCGASTATTACLNTRFAASVTFRDPNTGMTGVGQLVDCPNPDSALFWFFAPNAWEVMVKTINACTFNDRFWVFSAATTNVFYRLDVVDVRAGAAKIYFNYPGPPAPAVTDTAAFETCIGVGP
jgi:concanavalin A-like lectin/glucanase superfamily protein